MICLGIVVLSFTGTKAKAKETIQVLDLTKVEESSNGGDIAITKKGKTGIKVSFDTYGCENGYYTGAIICLEKLDLTNKRFLAIKIHVFDNTQLSVNFYQPEGEVSVLPDGFYAYVQEKEARVYELSKVQYGVFEVKAGFNGTIYIPLRNIYNQLKIRTADKVSIPVVLSEEMKSEFVIEQIAFYPDSVTGYEFMEGKSESLDGVTVVNPNIPMIGEVSKYRNPFAQEEKIKICDMILRGGVLTVFLGFIWFYRCKVKRRK